MMEVRKYFCESCHHTMITKNITIDKFWYGDLLVEALSYEKRKINYIRRITKIITSQI